MFWNYCVLKDVNDEIEDEHTSQKVLSTNIIFCFLLILLQFYIYYNFLKLLCSQRIVLRPLFRDRWARKRWRARWARQRWALQLPRPPGPASLRDRIFDRVSLFLSPKKCRLLLLTKRSSSARWFSLLEPVDRATRSKSSQPTTASTACSAGTLATSDSACFFFYPRVVLKRFWPCSYYFFLTSFSKYWGSFLLCRRILKGHLCVFDHYPANKKQKLFVEP